MKGIEYFFIGLVGGISFLMIFGLTPKHTREKFEKEAFKRGYMEKTINDKDQVIYRWKEKQ